MFGFILIIPTYLKVTISIIFKKRTIFGDLLKFSIDFRELYKDNYLMSMELKSVTLFAV
jgi:hypothetical protein